MKSIQLRAEALRTRLVYIIDTTAGLQRQVCELNALRDRMRKERVSARSLEIGEATHTIDREVGMSDKLH